MNKPNFAEMTKQDLEQWLLYSDNWKIKIGRNHPQYELINKWQDEIIVGFFASGKE